MASELFDDAIRDLNEHVYNATSVDPRIHSFRATSILFRFINGLDQAVTVTIEGTDDIDGTAFAAPGQIMQGTSIATGNLLEHEATSNHELVRVRASVGGTTAPTTGTLTGRAIVWEP